MSSTICTLFEGHYHHGVGVLSNSLYNSGYRGSIYVGYRGNLPNWTDMGTHKKIGKWDKALVLEPIEALKLIFLPLNTTYSLTNYKPDFMLELWQGPAASSDSMFYFDPDIIINRSWEHYKQWVNCGVALSEDINSPLQKYHPRRVGWRNYFIKHNFKLKFKNSIYVNGGFIGLLKKDLSFIKGWIKVQEAMGPAIGGLENSIFSNNKHKSTIPQMKGFHIFDKSDQDALNATCEIYEGNLSFIGKEGMNFNKNYGGFMFHAIGSPKPWKTKYLVNALLKANKPRALDKLYWNNAFYPLKSHSRFEIIKAQFSIWVSKFITRFYNN